MTETMMPGAYEQNAAAVTERKVPLPKQHKAGGLFGRKKSALKTTAPAEAVGDARELIGLYRTKITQVAGALDKLRVLKRPRLLGKVEDEIKKTERASAALDEAERAAEDQNMGECGKAFKLAHRELLGVGGSITLALNQELSQAAFSRQDKAALDENAQARKGAQERTAAAGARSARQGNIAAAEIVECAAAGFEIAARILQSQAPAAPRPAKRSSSKDSLTIVPPQELETFADVGGLDEAKERLQRTVGVMLERAGQAASAGVVINGVLLYGPPGTGKTLLARAVAGEYGLRFLRFSPAAIASSYSHEPATKLRELFERAADATPCLLFLDEVDTIAGRRESGGLSADRREVVTQLLNSLEEYRKVPSLIIMAATNTLDDLDPALREGRFDVRIAVPLPDARARAKILKVQLESSGLEVDWDSIDLDEVSAACAGRSGAALASIVGGAAERALSAGAALGQSQLMEEIEGRSGQDRAQTFEEQITWDDVVLPEAARQKIQEVLLIFRKPELGRKLGVAAPAGILLYGPPGTGKTTIAKALATEVKASFYEQSAADLLSKWVGESEQKVAQLFNRARANRPSIIFIDEIDALLKRRQSDSSSPWEERVVSQFLRELDGLQASQGVLLVGATNRPDIIDEAVRDRRLTAIQVPLPDEKARRGLLEVLCRDVQIAKDVDLDAIAKATESLSGADLKSIRNSAGMKALTRAAAGSDDEAAITQADFKAALTERGVELKARKSKRA